jgi:soluble lytic murein transglycosylase-like protein
MFSPTRRGRALDRCLYSSLLLIAGACGAGAPALPVGAPQPAAAPLRVTSPRKPAAKIRPRAEKPASQPIKPVRTSAPIRLDSTALERTVTREHAYWPLAVALARRSGNPEIAEQAAVALVHEAERLRLSPSLLGAVLLIENTPLDPTAVSSQGAIGLMQVMPVHRGSYGCPADLVNVETNICHGASILKHMVRRTTSLPLALKRYNGCVRGRNTPRCYRYPVRVLRTASRLRRETLLIAADTTIGFEAALSSAARTTSSGSPQLVMREDSLRFQSSAGNISCASFLGCLRHRWTLKY